ncbi:hypothetical protein VTO42DRAFT_5950 [Malbranchea cinnamomea]
MDSEWIQRFGRILQQLGPSLNYIDCPEFPARYFEPSKIETNLGDDDEFYQERIVRNERVLPGSPPAEIVHLIYDQLDSYDDVMRLKEATLVEPTAAVWLRLGRKFRALPQFRSGNVCEVALKIRRALWKVHHHPKAFPNALAHTICWDNSQFALAKMNE